MNQCDATTGASTYSDAHRCLKRHGIEKTGEKNLCAHHRSMSSQKTRQRTKPQ